MADDVFLYRKFELDGDKRTVRFGYSLHAQGKKHELTEVIKFPLELEEDGRTTAVLRALHLALGISYYKIFVPKEIEHPYAMTQPEADFWNEVFREGLGEFLYVNKLDKARIARFSAQEGIKPSTDTDEWEPAQRAMLGIGGGKDSIVAGELLKTLGVELDGFVMATGEQLGQSQAVAETMGVGFSPVERSLDKQLLELQEQPGAYKGHVPISLVFGLVGAVLAVAQDASYVVVANESSASIPRAEWQGMAVNHQWSKSFGFEQRLQAYLKTYVSDKLTYFSAIRPLSSVGVARLFRRYRQYLDVFTSDNSVFRIDPAKRPNGRWSLESPKSLSSFILLGAWLKENDLLHTFGRDFLNEPSLEKLFYELVGLEGHQPLDCVGTVDELVLSLNLMAQKDMFTDSFLMQKARERGVIAEKDWFKELSQAIQPSDEQVFPDHLRLPLGALLRQKEWPLEQFDDKNVVFVGAGKGRAMNGVKQFLSDHSQMASFEGVDKRPDDGEPLGFLKGFDPEKTVFIKNEGIPGPEMPVPYITPLQLFFDFVHLTGATTVGITGTKGKTTTTALTAHILEQAGKHVVLAGNIGVSPLQALDFATPDTIFVLELSSYQLSDLKKSPHISACINLYNDHTDWHGSLEAYWEAKHNIMRFAEADDVFIYNPEFPALVAWAREASCITRTIDENDPFTIKNAKLYGEHNRLNALVARQIAHEFGVGEQIIRDAVDSFEPIEHRMEYVNFKGDHVYINDAIGMTPESTSASVKAVAEKFGVIGCILLGGQDRNYDFTSMMQLIAGYKVPSLVMFPNTVEKMRQALPEGYNPEIFETDSMEEAVKFAAEHSPENSVVLLSTGAPSYLLWKDFEEKGRQFKAAVQDL